MIRLATTLAALTVVLALGACGGGHTRDGGAAVDAAASPSLELPAIDGSGTVSLGALTSNGKPTLLWFWAPWCEICNAEAAGIERLAARARGKLQVVAIGGRDEIAAGREFVARHRLRSPVVLFDEPEAAWEAYGIGPQPAAVLLDDAGRERRRWYGPVAADEVLAAAAQG